ncbi:hypothetical protein BJ508DRAFT_419883 [Ascobolus immersus RN42]|uniref:Uncharacterized protein n=1 Tax=Ascobolus immersus RN42 TaxID=1160509 RepID=A0A3N4HAE6_ASCIM|nr:hypothetical protein BJ508DRAFT_419883 [Ascobolus immersus RN42]
MQLTKFLTLAALVLTVSAQAALSPDDAAPTGLFTRSDDKETKTSTLKLTVCLAKKKSCKTRTSGEISKKEKDDKELYPLKLDKCYNFGKKYNDKVRFIQVESEVETTIKRSGKKNRVTKKKGKGCCRFYRQRGCGGGELKKQKNGDKKEEVRWFEKRISSFRCEEKC